MYVVSTCTICTSYMEIRYIVWYHTIMYLKPHILYYIDPSFSEVSALALVFFEWAGGNTYDKRDRTGTLHLFVVVLSSDSRML